MNGSSPIAFAAPLVRLSRRRSEMGFERWRSGGTPRRLCSANSRHIGASGDTESQAKDDVEFSVLLFAEFADIVLHKLAHWTRTSCASRCVRFGATPPFLRSNYLSFRAPPFRGRTRRERKRGPGRGDGNRPACNIAGHLDDAPDDRLLSTGTPLISILLVPLVFIVAAYSTLVVRARPAGANGASTRPQGRSLRPSREPKCR